MWKTLLCVVCCQTGCLLLLVDINNVGVTYSLWGHFVENWNSGLYRVYLIISCVPCFPLLIQYLVSLLDFNDALIGSTSSNKCIYSISDSDLHLYWFCSQYIKLNCQFFLCNQLFTHQNCKKKELFLKHWTKWDWHLLMRMANFQLKL